MDTTHAVIALQSLTGLVGVLVIWNIIWPRHVIYAARQRFFAVRDRLFLIAVQGQGGLSFDSPAYQKMRKQINSMINSLDYLHIWLVLGLMLNHTFKHGWKKVDPNAASTNASGLGIEAQAALQSIERQTSVVTLKFLLVRTPLSSALLLLPAGFIALLLLLVAGIYGLVKRAITGSNSVFDPEPTVALHQRFKQSIVTEGKIVVRRADEFDEYALWTSGHRHRHAGFSEPCEVTLQAR